MLPSQLPAALQNQLSTTANLFNKYAMMVPYAYHTLVKSFVLDAITQLDSSDVPLQDCAITHPPILSSSIQTEQEMELEFKRAFTLVKTIRDRVFRIVMKYFLRFVAFHMYPVMQSSEKRAFWRSLFDFFFLNENAMLWRHQGGPDIFGYHETLHFLKNSHFQDLFSYWLLKQFFSKPHFPTSSFVQLYDWVDKFSDLVWAQEEPQINEHSTRGLTDDEQNALNLTLHISKDDVALFQAYFEEINWSVQMEALPLNFLDDLHQRDFILAQNGMSSPLSNLETATSRFLTSVAESQNEMEEEQVLEMVNELEKDIDNVIFSKLNP